MHGPVVRFPSVIVKTWNVARESVSGVMTTCIVVPAHRRDERLVYEQALDRVGADSPPGGAAAKPISMNPAPGMMTLSNTRWSKTHAGESRVIVVSNTLAFDCADANSALSNGCECPSLAASTPARRWRRSSTARVRRDRSARRPCGARSRDRSPPSRSRAPRTKSRDEGVEHLRPVVLPLAQRRQNSTAAFGQAPRGHPEQRRVRPRLDEGP